MTTLETYLQQHYSAETAKAYRREISIYLDNYKDAATANYKDLTHYIGLLRTRYKKPATISRIVSSIKVYYDYLCSEGIRNDNPTKAIKLRDKRSRDIQLQDLFTPEELEQLLHRKERYAGLETRNKVLISLLIYQALYPQEIEALAVNNIDLKEGNVFIKATPKTNSRTLSLKPNQVLLFYEYLTEIRNKLASLNPSKGGTLEQCLILSLRGTPMTAGDITKHVKRLAEVLPSGGFRRAVNAQTIRQSVIMNLLKQGNDISVVQAFAGHKYPSATEKYRQNEIEALQAAVNKYHPLQ